MTKQSIYLAMIVKNEQHVIERCLRSVMPHMDGVVIHDTGSTDDTLGLIYRVLNDWPHLNKVIKRVDWVHFACNRNKVLEDVYDNGAGYVFTIDADEELITSDAPRPLLSKDLYTIPIEYSGVSYTRDALFRNDGTFHYNGEVHEYLSRDLQPINRGHADWGWKIVVRHEGARSKDPDTYKNDAKILEKALEFRTVGSYDYARTAYYLAQSYRDAGDYLTACDRYLQRSKMTYGWHSERWHAAYQAARMFERAQLVNQAFLQYIEAFNMDPSRPEALYYAAMMWKSTKSHWPLREMLLERAFHTLIPVAGLFLEPEVYKWLIPMELSVARWYMGDKIRGRALTDGLLANLELPAHHRATLESNLKFYE